MSCSATWSVVCWVKPQKRRLPAAVKKGLWSLRYVAEEAEL